MKRAGNLGLAKSEDRVAEALNTCLRVLRPLSLPHRQRVMRGVHAWLLESETGPPDDGGQ